MRASKFLLITVLTATMVSTSFGCGTLLSGEPGEEETKTEGRLPEWLQASYRKTEGYRFDHEDNDIDADDFSEEDLVDPEAIDEYAETEEEPPAEETDEKPESPVDEEDTEPVTAEATEPTDEEVSEDKPKRGTMDYVIWKREQEKKDEDKSVFGEDDTWWEVDVDPAGFDHHVIQHGDQDTDEDE